jgi:predicted NBD/HSP70 family sugar kinase
MKIVSAAQVSVQTVKPLLESKSKQVRHQSIIKESNIKRVFTLVLENESISRSEISKEMNLSRSTVSLLVDELEKIGLIRLIGERESDSLGRRPIGLEVNGDSFQVISLGIRKKNFVYKLYDLKGNELDALTQKVVYKKGFGEKIRKTINAQSHRLDAGKLLAVCVSIPAKIVNDNSLSLSILNVHGGCDLFTELKSMWPDIPLVAGNQSSAYVYAEYKVMGGNIDDMLYFNIGEGVAAGIVANDRVFTGEIGHMSIDPNGPHCSCGKRGCLENVIGDMAILQEFRDLAEKDRKGLLYSLCKGEPSKLDYHLIRQALDGGDPGTVKTARDIAGKIAFGISNVICMFDPRKIVLGGGVEGLGEYFLNLIIQKIEIPGNGGAFADKAGYISGTVLSRNADLKGMFYYFIDRIFSITLETENKIHYWN